MGAKATKEPERDNYRTPPNILAAVDEFYNGAWFDPCPPNPEFDGLAMRWGANTYINPPFSKYKQWAEHGKHQPFDQIWMSNHCHDTEWWQALPVDAMCLLFDRVIFIDPKTGKPVVGKDGKPQTQIGQRQTLRYRGNNISRFAKVFQGLGQIVEVRNYNPMEGRDGTLPKPL